MLKAVLSIIISLSLALTSGISQPVIAQQRLTQTLQELGTTGFNAEITAWAPDQSRNNFLTQGLTAQELPDSIKRSWQVSLRNVSADGSNLVIATLRTSNSADIVQTYLNVRSNATHYGGGANLTIKAELPGVDKYPNRLGERLITQLGGKKIAQEVVDNNLFSAASEIKGWGQTITVGQDMINLQIVLRPDSRSKNTHLYIMAPVLLTDF